MDVKKLLATVPIGRSQYEFDNFVTGGANSEARYVRDLLLEKEQLERAVQETSEDFRQNDRYQKELAQVNAVLNSFTEEQIEATLANFEAEEGQYWAAYLGKIAAIESLTLDRPTPETLDKLALLPIEDFKNSVIITNRIMEYIRSTTARIEQEAFGSEAEGLGTGSDIQG
jgi:hypothetical protein